jgi:hypothetical protein
MVYCNYYVRKYPGRYIALEEKGRKKKMIAIIYQIIILFFLVLVIRDMFKEENIWNQLTGSLVIIPFILRLLMIK